MKAVQRWRDYARQYGTTGLMKYLVARLLRPVRERAVVELYVATTAGPILEARRPIRIAELTPSEGRALRLAGDDWETRWRQGDRCFVAWEGETCVHFSWVSTRENYLAEAHRRIELEDGQAYVYDCFTAGAQRGAGIFPAVLSFIREHLYSEGRTCIWIAVEEENLSSKKAIERAGFSKVGTVTYDRWGKRVISRVDWDKNAPPLTLVQTD